MVFPEQLDEIPIADDLGIEHHLHRLGVAGQAAAHLLVGGIGGQPPLIPGGGGIDPGLLPEQTLHTPETAHAEPGKLHPLGPGPLGRVAVYCVHLANLQRFPPSRQRLCR